MKKAKAKKQTAKNQNQNKKLVLLKRVVVEAAVVQVSGVAKEHTQVALKVLKNRNRQKTK